jgi:hypothetical protein
MDPACITLRGFEVGIAVSDLNDDTVEQFLSSNLSLFDKLMAAMPDYTHRLMFSPEIASTVMATLGVSLSANTIHDLAASRGFSVTHDLDGRRGISTQFIRSLTLTVSARTNFR